MFELVEALRVSSNNGHDFVLCFSKWDWVIQPSLDCPWSWQSENQFPHVLHYFPSLTEFFKENKNGAGNCATIIYSAIQDFRYSQSIRNRNFFFEMHFLHYLLISSLFLNRAHGHNPNKLQKSKDLEGHITAKLKLFNISVSYLKISKNIQKN